METKVPLATAAAKSASEFGLLFAAIATVKHALRSQALALDSDVGDLHVQFCKQPIERLWPRQCRAIFYPRQCSAADACVQSQNFLLRAQPVARIVPHPVLMEMFAQKIAALHATLDGGTIRSEAAALLDRLIESVTIYPDGANGPAAEVVSKVADLAAWALNDNAAPGGGMWCSMVLVAGVGFEPTTFRL